MRYFTLSAILLAGLGCTNVQPIGPLAKHPNAKSSTPSGTRRTPHFAAPSPTPAGPCCRG